MREIPKQAGPGTAAVSPQQQLYPCAQLYEHGSAGAAQHFDALCGRVEV